MNILITVHNPRSKKTWDEGYRKPEITSTSGAKKWAHDLIKWFNSTAQPGGSTRKLIKVRTFSDSEPGEWMDTRR